MLKRIVLVLDETDHGREAIVLNFAGADVVVERWWCACAIPGTGEASRTWERVKVKRTRCACVDYTAEPQGPFAEIYRPGASTSPLSGLSASAGALGRDRCRVAPAPPYAVWLSRQPLAVRHAALGDLAVEMPSGREFWTVAQLALAGDAAAVDEMADWTAALRAERTP